ncbi:Ribosome biogenesis protein nsa2 [Colletotrichum fructicola]|nr:Ribosome biogenesis protein nsa2 [Colletotrichum fructicola]KAF4910572.1 Ribosome biogenesis protein nsa2 [Colletotrichum fructicola]KAF4939117.1 Ribosome biogenesis protein nsa2 [Colletotrichum fructicola]
MPQNQHIKRWRKRHGKHYTRYREASKKAPGPGWPQQSHDVQSLHGIRAKMMQGKRRVGKIQMRNLPSDPVLHYLLDRNEPSATKALASSIKQRRNEKAARLNITLPEVRSISEDEMFKVVTTGKKTHQRSWKRIVTKPIFVGEGFTRQNPKAERPMGLRQKFAHRARAVNA